ncbi:RAD50-interacting protein 1-like [Ostrea edulis]|uniref:RAD50-interacting protein 1-like n=1 Tax=Ostrea edulis TaxID=37623 RepID=UPI0024AFDA39|nr:RAD50-interacting protein 1-like [Ostrea edulis]
MDAPLSNSDESKKNAVEIVNKKFGNDIKSLSDLKSFYSETRKATQALESRLALTEWDIPPEVDEALQNAEEAQTTVTALQTKSDSLHHDILDHCTTLKNLVEDLTPLINQVDELNKYKQYLSCVAHIENISIQIHSALMADRTAVAVDEFCSLTEYYIQKQNSQCQNLLQFLKDTILFWYDLLKARLSSLLEESLKAVGWPLIATSIKTPPPPSDPSLSMDAIFLQLLLLQLPEPLSKEVQKKTLTFLSQEFSFKPLLLPIQHLVTPLHKRFKYHFYGNKQTNNWEKPEWYFGQVLNWIRDHSSFLDQRIQHLLEIAGFYVVDAKVEFMRGLVVLVMEKMAADLPTIMEDEHLFCHLVDEAIFFDHELHQIYHYPTGLNSSMDILTVPRVFDRWIEIEKKFAIEKMDSLLSSTTAWESQYKNIADIDTLKVPECGESFVTLMSTITDRYKYLPSPDHRLKFLGMQLELLEDFRIRLVQVMKEVTHDSLGDTFCAIFNAVHYITEVLREWCNATFFVELQYHSAARPVEFAADPGKRDAKIPALRGGGGFMADKSVFDEGIDLYDKLKIEMEKNILNHAFVDVQARSQPYRKMKWRDLEESADLSLTTAACDMLMVLRDHLLTMNRKLSKPLFVKLWRKLADKMSKFMLDEVVLQNRFSEAGAKQLEFDMTRNLFPLFAEYTTKPQNYFRQINEACVLLCLRVGSALLLREVLMSDDSVPEKEQALQDVGVYKLAPQVALNVLHSRTNLSVT